MQNEIIHLTKTVSDFIKESSERAVRLETTQEHISEALLKMTQTVDKALASNSELEMKVTSLEDRALDRMYLVEDSLNELSQAYKDVVVRVCDLELCHAREEGRKEVRNNVSNFISNNWFKIITVVVLSIPLVSWLYENSHTTPEKPPTSVTRGK